MLRVVPRSGGGSCPFPRSEEVPSVRGPYPARATDQTGTLEETSPLRARGDFGCTRSGRTRSAAHEVHAEHADRPPESGPDRAPADLPVGIIPTEMG
jgi:hypothetical protein